MTDTKIKYRLTQLKSRQRTYQYATAAAVFITIIFAAVTNFTLAKFLFWFLGLVSGAAGVILMLTIDKLVTLQNQEKEREAVTARRTSRHQKL